jgi:hypothetical protein
MKKNGGDGSDGMHSYAKQLSKRKERERESEKKKELKNQILSHSY